MEKALSSHSLAHLIKASSHREQLSSLTEIDLYETASTKMLPMDIILGCTICQKSLSSIYTEDHNDGLRRDGMNAEDGTIPKLWLTECAHLTCAKHFEGGGKCSISHLAVIRILDIF